MSEKTALAKATKAEIAERVDLAMRNFEAAVGGREALVAALQHSPETDELNFVIGIIADPRNDTSSLTAICRDAGIGVGKLWQLFKDSDLAQAQVLAIRAINRKLTEVVDDVLLRAVPYEVVCDTCYGLDVGRTARGKAKPCPDCGGKGTRTKEPDLKRQEMVLRMGGLLKDGGGVSVNVQQQANTFVAGDAMGKFQRASDRILYGERERAIPAAAEES